MSANGSVLPEALLKFRFRSGYAVKPDMARVRQNFAYDPTRTWSISTSQLTAVCIDLRFESLCILSIPNPRN